MVLGAHVKRLAETALTFLMRIAIVGGGIAGTSCAQELLKYHQDGTNLQIDLFHQGPVIKVATHLRRLTDHLEQFNIEDRVPGSSAVGSGNTGSRITYIQCTVNRLDLQAKILYGKGGETYGPYRQICLCTGAHPYLPPPAKRAFLQSRSDRLLTLRDTDSVRLLNDRLKQFQSMAVVGNGGIAMELVYALRDHLNIHWLVRQDYIGNPYFDAGASAFFLTSKRRHHDKTVAGDNSCSVEMSSAGNISNCQPSNSGPSVGPHWVRFFEAPVTTGGKGGALNIEYNAHLLALTPFHNNVKLTLQNGKQLTVDAVIFATGVEPNTQFLTAETADAGLKLSEQDGGIVVDQFMQTSVAGIYAAGDVCSIEWQHGQSPPSLWFQMRLWTQARQMGCQCAQTMLNELSSSATDGSFENNFTMAFELFAHTTVFFGFKVVLLGRFNDGETTNEVLIRCTPGQEYIKVILDRNGRMVGAMLIGETDLEETFENLILNGMDLSAVKSRLLEPDFDAEDYFD